jgi:hypothetical protein
MMRAMHAPAALLGFLFCASVAAAGPAPSPPGGFWIVASAEPARAVVVGTAFRFRADGYDLVDAGGRADRRPAAWSTSADGHRWTERSGGAKALSVEQRGAELVLSSGLLRARLVRAPAERAAALERALAAVPSAAETCRRAEACCVKATRLLDAGACDVKFQLGDRSASTCSNTLTGFRTLLAQKKIAPPPECR